jgi:hypothetical protein
VQSYFCKNLVALAHEREFRFIFIGKIFKYWVIMTQLSDVACILDLQCTFVIFFSQFFKCVHIFCARFWYSLLFMEYFDKWIAFISSSCSL